MNTCDELDGCPPVQPEVEDGSNEDWLVWQLADSAFPTGGFAHSGGLEAAWQHGEVGNPAALQSFLEASLEQIGRASIPFVTATYDNPVAARELDLYCDAFLTSHVANRASRLQGRAFLASSSKIFRSAELARKGGEFSLGHFAPAFGAVTRLLGLSRSVAARLFVFQHLRGLVAGAIRLGIAGPMEAQACQYRLAARSRFVLSRCEGLTLTEAAQTAPVLEIWQGTQDRLYSRLFQT